MIRQSVQRIFNQYSDKSFVTFFDYLNKSGTIDDGKLIKVVAEMLDSLESLEKKCKTDKTE